MAAATKSKTSPAPTGVIQGGREVTENERLTGVSRRPDDPLKVGPSHQKLNDRAADLLEELTQLREDAYNAGHSVLAQIVKGAERELRVSALGFVRFNEDDADQRPKDEAGKPVKDGK